MKASAQRFHNKVVLVFGGNSGIGLASAEAFAAEGARVVITGRNPESLAVAGERIGEGTLAVKSDISNLADLDLLYALIRERHGRIDVVFVNAGIGTFASVREITPEGWDEIQNVNLRGAFFAAQKALPLMSRGGSIVFTSSIGSVLAAPGTAIYAASKAGLRAVARIFAAELVAEGIRVNVVSPGATETAIMTRNPEMSADAVDSLRAMIISNTPMKRMGRPEEIARAVLFLASDDASFVTGVDFYVDGGAVEL